MDEDLKKILEKTANTIRQLSFEGVQKANSGHPGLPMGCAEFGAYLYGYLMKHNPKNSHWINRDRFVLSAGHGSMFLYSCLHLSGFDVSIEDLKHFRKLHSKTPGHPEYGETDGVESTTGPLGQGVGNAVGQALGYKILAKKFNKPSKEIFTNKIFCLAGDGCLMEGVSSEASSLAGHLGLDNFVLFHDANQITLDGPLEESGSENTKERYKAYGFDVYEMDGNDLDSVHSTLTKALENQTKPIFVEMKTIIGKGSPNKQGTFKVHGAPLGEEEVEATKKALGLPEEEFYVPQVVTQFFETKLEKEQELEENWKATFTSWKNDNPEESNLLEVMLKKEIPTGLEKELKALEIKDPIAGRSASQACLNVLGKELPFLYGGSADLSVSDATMMKELPIIKPHQFDGRNIKYGIREFGMATIASGLWQTGMIIPYIGTFLTFSDYMRNAIRLASLARYQVIYQFTHDSIFLGEDGPTHQPVEHYMALRAIPRLHVLRPADANEVKMSWIAALHYQGPSAIILSRQNLPALSHTDVSYEEGVAKGAYIIKKEKSKPDFTLVATGSEVSLALDVAEALEKMGKHVRVISMPCFELFDLQSKEYRKSLFCGDIGKRVSLEAGISLGWQKWIGSDGISISVDDFGASAPIGDLKQEYGFTVESILDRLL